ncbi:hypothetical protein [Stenotrophomonas sp.]|uniref:hypothetical protein n=1 Tax=Stenotrophomonas sp. TaxID=69392 RepID=UPI0028987007|nr:hypothetical protein [Stenotrophomonas sp.]
MTSIRPRLRALPGRAGSGISAALGIAVLLLVSACQTRPTPPAVGTPDAPDMAESLAPDASSPVIGQGRHRVQFLLRDTITQEPAAHRPFALSHADVDLPFVTEEKDVYQGITDAQGRTPVIALERAAPAHGWMLLERFGSGPFGERMRVVGAGGTREFPGVAYEVVVCSSVPQLYRGVTNAMGDTAYFASAGQATLHVSVMAYDGSDAQALKAAIAPAADDAQRARHQCAALPDDAD